MILDISSKRRFSRNKKLEFVGYMTVVIPLIEPLMHSLKLFYKHHRNAVLVIEIIGLLYVLLGLAYITNSYLMPVLQKLIKRYNLSHNFGGVLVAIGVALPEFFTNLISCLSPKEGMFGFGLGSIIGSGVYDFTICFGIAAIYSYNYHGRAIAFELKPLKRDLKIYIATLVYLVFVFWDFKITLIESFVLVLLTPLYFVLITYEDRQARREQAEHKKFAKSEFLLERYNVFYTNNEAVLTDYSEQEMHKRDEEEDEEEGEQMVHGVAIKKVVTEPGLKANYYNQDNYFKSSTDQFFSKVANALYWPWKILYQNTVPIKKPILGFLAIMVYFFLITKYSIFTVDSIMEKLPFSHTFMGLTFGAWGGNVGDIFTVAVAAKNMQTEIASSSIIGSQIFNLQICLGIPWLVTCIFKGPIPFPDPTIFISICVIIIMVVFSFMVMVFLKLRLTYTMGAALISIYLVYMFIEYLQL